MKYPVQILISTVLIIAIASCSAPEDIETQINNVDTSTAVDLIKDDKNIVVLDVRTPEEHAAGHIEGSLNINITENNFSEEAAKLDRNKTYIIHCAANTKNGRTDKSVKIMNELGFKKLVNLEGGIVAWKEGGHPLIKNNPPEENPDGSE